MVWSDYSDMVYHKIATLAARVRCAVPAGSFSIERIAMPVFRGPFVIAGTRLRLPDWARQVTGRSLGADAMAGLTGATIVLPQGIAFAAIAGLPPEYGFYTAMVAAVVAAFAGSSWHSVTGPTTAISALVFGALAGALVPGTPDYIAAAIALAAMVGVIQIAFGLGRLGALIDFVSHSVMVGFIAGAAIIIGLSQMRAVLGIGQPESLTLTSVLAGPLPDLHGPSLVVAAVTLATGALLRWWRPAWPHYILALATGTAAGFIAGGAAAGLDTVGAIGAVTPSFGPPPLSLELVRDFGSAAAAVAVVGLLEALSVGRALAARSGQAFDGNREILGQGLANLVGSFFHCFPASASFTRSGVNLDAGARTPLAAVMAAAFLFAILQFVAPWFAHVPDAAIGAVILLVAWRLIDFRAIRHLVRTSGSEAFIAASTFLATLLVSLEVSIYVGVFLSFVFFARTASRPHIGVGAPNPAAPRRRFGEAAEENLSECPQLMITRLDGPLFFGSVEHVRRQFRHFELDRPGQTHMIFVVKGVGEIDMPGAELLIEEAKRRHARGGSFHLQTRTPRTISKLARFRVMRSLTKQRIHLSKGDAIAEIVPMLDPAVCAACTARVFKECPMPAGGPGGEPA